MCSFFSPHQGCERRVGHLHLRRQPRLGLLDAGEGRTQLAGAVFDAAALF